MRFLVKHVTFRKAAAFIQAHHRHHKPPQGGIVCLGAFCEAGFLCGVAVLGRPVARMSDDGNTMELTRLCVLQDERNLASFLIAKARRVAQALGFSRLITFTLPEEGGRSLRAAGSEFGGVSGGGQWSRPSRNREGVEQPGEKHRWAWTLAPEPVRVLPPWAAWEFEINRLTTTLRRCR